MRRAREAILADAFPQFVCELFHRRCKLISKKRSDDGKSCIDEEYEFDEVPTWCSLSTVMKPKSSEPIVARSHVQIADTRKHTCCPGHDDKSESRSNIGSSMFLLLGLIAFRLFNALVIRTTFVPDEVWQSVEVAHRWVYGYGALTWEWIPTVAIRSPLYPLFFAAMYKFIAFFGVDSRDAIVLLPRLFHGLLAGVIDYTIYLMAVQLSGKSSAKWVLLAEMTSWFTAYCAPRSLINSLEWALHAVAFHHYPWPLSLGLTSTTTTTATAPFLFFVCVGMLIRPTAAIIWAPVCLHYLLQIRREVSSQKFWHTLRLAMMIGLPCTAISLVADRLVFDHWTVNQLNFLLFNFLSNGAEFYGVQPWHWYLTSGLPSILVFHLPLMLIGWLYDVRGGCHWRMKKRGPALKDTSQIRANTVAKYFGVWAAWTVGAYSCLAHKEIRFLFPLFPVFVYYAGRGLYHLSRSSKESWSSRSCCPTFKQLIGFLVVANLTVAGYTCTVHQRGPEALMATLARQAAAADWASMSSKPSILILMPCHSTPYLSYLHVNTSLRLLACDPDLSSWHNTDPRHYVDEAEAFYQEPTRWLNTNYLSSSSLPQYIAMFTELTQNIVYGEAVARWLRVRNYSICADIFHSHIVSHHRHSERIAVLCAKGYNLHLARKENVGGGFPYSFL